MHNLHSPPDRRKLGAATLRTSFVADREGHSVDVVPSLVEAADE